ncbi:MAG: penicillin-binding protein [Bacteriovoracaceae bacterium]
MKSKIIFTFVVFLVLFSAVVVKAFYVQVLNRDKLLAYSHSQIAREVKIYPRRGHILDRNGAPLAINVQKYNLFTFGKDMVQVKKELALLKKVLPQVDVSSLLKEIKKRGKFTWIARRVELKEKQVKQLKGLEEVFIEAQPARMYPNNELLAQTLGFVGLDNEGLAGVEYSFNEMLKGEAQIHKYFKDAKGRPVKLKSAIVESKSQDVLLSIDKDIQADLEEYLKEGVEEHEAQMGGAAVMDAQTGEILAMANYPGFDPNKITNKDKNNIRLSFVSDPFEPGSVFKTFTIAAGLKNNIVKPDTNYYCEKGKLKIGGHTISESDNNHMYEWLSVEDILAHSSNIGTTKIAFDVTFPTLKETLEEFNLGDKTGIELPGESRGILDKRSNVPPIRLSNISFGQGVATTGVQMLAAYAAIANSGRYVRPTILKVKDPKEVKSKKILSRETSSILSKMLEKAVKEGTGSNAQINHFDIAGKTSTAQRVDSAGGYKGYVSAFVGFPVNVEKKFVVFVYVDNPTNGYYGNAVAAPIFQKIVKNILYKRKEYNQLANTDSGSFGNMDSLSAKYSSKRSLNKGYAPNLIGLDKASARNILESLNLKFSHSGFGIVTEQHPEAGAKVSADTVMRVKFQAPSYE